MTKQDPDKLCESCKEFDYIMNRKDGISFDMYVVCEHDECQEVSRIDHADGSVTWTPLEPVGQ